MRLSSDFAFISKLPLKIRMRSTFTIVFGNHTIIYQEKEKKGSFLELYFYLFYLFNLSESFKKKYYLFMHFNSAFEFILKLPSKLFFFFSSLTPPIHLPAIEMRRQLKKHIVAW